MSAYTLFVHLLVNNHTETSRKKVCVGMSLGRETLTSTHSSDIYPATRTFSLQHPGRVVRGEGHIGVGLVEGR